MELLWTKFKSRSILEKIAIIYVTGLIALFPISLVVKVFVKPAPMTCEEAKTELARAKYAESNEWKRLEDGKLGSYGAANVAIQDAKAEVEKYDNAVAAACRK